MAHRFSICCAMVLSPLPLGSGWFSSRPSDASSGGNQPGDSGGCTAAGLGPSSTSSGCGAAKHCTELRAGESLAVGEWLTSPSGSFIAVLESDHFRVISANGSVARWRAPQRNDSLVIEAAHVVRGRLILETAEGPAWTSPAPQDCRVELYQHGNFAGWSAKFAPGVYDESGLVASGARVKDVSSVKVFGPMCTAVLFERGDFGGWSAEFTEGSYDFPAFSARGAKNDAVSSLKVIGSGFWVFSNESQRFAAAVGEGGIECRCSGGRWDPVHVVSVTGSQAKVRLQNPRSPQAWAQWVDFSSGRLRKIAAIGPARLVLSDEGTLMVRTATLTTWRSNTADDLVAEIGGAPAREEQRHAEEMGRCSHALSCQPCIGMQCAWCLASRRCVADKAWICQGDEDHVSPPGQGTIGKASCPTREAIENGHRQRRERTLASIASTALPFVNLESDDDGHTVEQASSKDHGSDGAPSASLDSDADSDEDVDQALVAELLQRARFADEERGTRPYDVLKVGAKASTSDIRKAYRRLSVRFHPDKWARARQAWRQASESAFADIQKAYEMLGTPDKRAAFDDYRGDNFDRHWEDDANRKWQGGEDFYYGDPYIATLTEELWERRLTGKTIWLIEFYAAWCPACQKTRQVWRDVARKVEHLPIEVGAVNCVRQRRICGEYVGVTSYPSVKLISREMGTMQDYRKNLFTVGDDPSDMVRWVDQVSAEWRWLFNNAHVHWDLGPSSFGSGGVVADSPAMWVVAFLDGRECPSCKAMCTNLLRLSASLRGLPVQIGAVDCSMPDLRTFCYDEHQVPPPPHRALTKAWRAGRKNVSEAPEMGEVLYSPADLEPHTAVMFIEKLVRLALADRLSGDGLVERAPMYEEDLGPDDEPPSSTGGGQAGAQWQAPLVLQWDDVGVTDRRALPRPWQTFEGERVAKLT